LTSLLSRTEKRNGYFELSFDDYLSFKNFISPENHYLQELMTQLRYKHENLDPTNLPRFGSIPTPLPTIYDEVVFRGQADSSWTLTPSLFRDKRMHHISSPENIVREEYLNLIEFQKLCDQAGVQIPGDSFSRRNSQLTVLQHFDFNHMDEFWNIEFIEVATFAQHFGLETSLLDWSRNILTACYFSSMGAMTEKNKFQNNSGTFSIWVLNNTHLDNKIIKVIEPPKSINNHISHQNGLLTLSRIYPEISNLINPANGIQTEPKDFSMERILGYYKKDHLLLKLNIPWCFADDLFNYCNAFNFNACNLFRGAHGAVQHFKDLKTIETFQNNLNFNANNLADSY
jgi:hypothetical protein